MISTLSPAEPAEGPGPLLLFGDEHLPHCRLRPRLRGKEDTSLPQI